MAFYKKPIQPYDPINREGQDGGALRYFRNDFAYTGQNSYDTPPSQDAGQWMALTNVMPISRGNIDRRWGYFKLSILLTGSGQPFPAGVVPRHLYEYQRDTDGLRKIILTTTQPFSGGFTSQAIGEDGSTYASQITTAPTALPNTAPRELTSRSTAYFYAGVPNSNIKWDGSVTSGIATNVTNWGINVDSVVNSSSGPNLGGTASDVAGGSVAWTSPNNIKLDDGIYTTAALDTNPAMSSDGLKVTNFGLTASGHIAGLQADIKGHITVTGTDFVIKRPTTFAPYVGADFLSPANAEDGDPTTASEGIATLNDTGDSQAGEQWFGFPVYTGPTATIITLKVSSIFHIAGSNVGDATVAYSVNNGTSWTTIYTTASFRTLTTDSIPLLTTQDLTQVRVRALVEIIGGGTRATCSLSVVDTWIEITNSVPPPAVASISVQLIKNNLLYGDVKTFSPTSSSDTVFSFGGPKDLWGGIYQSTDITDSTFGLQITASSVFKFQGPIVIVSLDSVKLTAYLTGAGVVVGSPTSGAIDLTIGRIYYLAFKNAQTAHPSDLSSPSVTTGALSAKQVPLTLSVNTDPQVDKKLLLATADGGDPSILYLVTELPNSQTSYTDNTPETTLVLNQQYLFTDDFGNDFGIANNTPPPLGTLATKHKGRLWMAVGQLLYFSKSIVELTLPGGFIAGRYEEAWPATNYFDVSPGAETITGLLSDGDVLYIATSRHVRRLFGDDPSNFQEPEVVHQEAGVVSQDVWKPIFMQGTPSGTMWLTPDNRVMLSDFNTYRDVGEPVQNILDTINLSAVQNAHAAFYSQGPYDIYTLDIPTGTNTECDTKLVFNLRTQQWMVWTPTDQSTASLFNVTADGLTQWLFATPNYLYQFSKTVTQDQVGVSPTDYLSVAQTSWLDLGSPTFRKLLNEMEIVGNPTILVTVEGADTQDDFGTPEVVVTDVPLVRDPAGRLKVFLAGQRTRKHYYRFTFTSSGPSQDFLDSYSIYTIPFSTI